MKTRNWYKGLTATAITIAMAGTVFTVPAMAIEYDLNYGDVFVENNESWQQNAEGNQFHYVPGNEGSYEFVSGKYQHTQDDPDVVISQGNISKDEIVNNVDSDGTESDVFDNVMENASQNTADEGTVDSTVTTTDTSGEGNVDVTITDVNVDTDDTFLNVNGDANITISDSTIHTGSDAIDISGKLDDSSTTVDLTVENTTITVGDTDEAPEKDVMINGIHSSAGGADTTVNVTLDDTQINLESQGNGIISDGDGSTMNIYLEGNNTIDGSVALDRYKDTSAHRMVNGIRAGYDSFDGQGQDSYATVNIYAGDENGTLNLKNLTTGIIVNDDSSLTIDEKDEYQLDTETGESVLVEDNPELTVNISGIDAVTANSHAGRGVKVWNDSELNVKNGAQLNIQDTEKYGMDVNGDLNITNHANLNVSDTSTGMYFNSGNLNIKDHSIVEVHDTRSMGLNFSATGSVVNVEDASQLYIHNTGSHAIGGANDTVYNVRADSEIKAVDGGASGIQYGNLNVDDSRVIIENMTNTATWTYGALLNTLNLLNGSEMTVSNIGGKAGISVNGSTAQIQDSTLKVIDAKQAGIRLFLGADVEDSVVMTTGGNYGIILYDTDAGASVLNVRGASVLAVDGTVWDFYDDWNNLGYTGRDFMMSGSLQADLDAMYGYYIANDSSLAGKTGLELFLAIAAKYNKGDGVNAIVTGAPGGSIVAGGKNDTQYTGPVNENGTLLFRFDLNGEIDKGAAMTNNGDGTYTFKYTDPNTGKVVEYTFRYNADGEDLTGTGNNAYVWTPVTIIHYNPTENDLSESNIGTAQNNGDNTATDVTIYGTTINLAEKDMPSYETKVDTKVTTVTGDDGSVTTTTTTTTSTYGWWVHVDENGKLQAITPPDKDAPHAEWDAFYALLNYQVTEETNLLELCGGDTKLAESITVYGMWTTKVDQQVVVTPGEPEIPEPPVIIPEIPDPPVEIEDPDVPLVVDPEEPTEEIPDEETPLTPTIPDEEIDDIIAEIEEEVVPLANVPKTGAEMPVAAAALPAGVLALAVSALARRLRRKD